MEPIDGRKVSKLTYVHVETCTLVHVDAVLQLESYSDRFLVDLLLYIALNDKYLVQAVVAEYMYMYMESRTVY